MNNILCRYLLLISSMSMLVLITSCSNLENSSIQLPTAQIKLRTPQTTTSSPSSGRLSATADAIPIQKVDMMQPGAVLPVDIPQQISYAPGRAGGSRESISCYRQDLSASTDSQPALYTNIDHIDMGNSLTICYFGFTLGQVTEHIIAPDGTTVRKVQFTIEDKGYQKTIEANDYTAMPFDKSGIYTVISDTPNGSYSIKFTVTDSLLTSAKDRASLKILGRGTDATATKTAELIFLTGFSPQETIKLLFYQSCGYENSEYTFLIGALTTVETNGRALVNISPDIKRQLDLDRGYLIIAESSNPDKDTSSPPALYASTENGHRPLISTTSVYAFTSPTSYNLPKLDCPHMPLVPSVTLPDLPIVDFASANPPNIPMEPIIMLQGKSDLPTVFDKTMYITTYQSNETFAISAIDIGSGTLIWNSKNIPGKSVNWIHVTNRMVYIFASNTLHAIDMTNGQDKWTLSFDNELINLIDASNESVYIRIQKGQNNERIIVLGSQTGTFLWEHQLESNESVYGLEPKINILLLAKAIQKSSTQQQIFALDASNGQIKWQLTVPASRTYSRDNGIIYMQNGLILFSTPTQVPSTQQQIFALDADTGQIKWNFSANAITWNIITSKDLIYLGGADHIYALNIQTGQTLWTFKGAPGYFSYKPLLDQETLYVGSNGVFFAGRYQGYLYALDIQTGHLKWKQTFKETTRAFTIAEGVASALSGDSLYGMDTQTGQLKWQLKFNKNISTDFSDTREAFGQNGVYRGVTIWPAFPAVATWYFNLSDSVPGGIFELDAQTGQLKGYTPVLGDWYSLNTINGRLYVSTNEGTIYTLH